MRKLIDLFWPHLKPLTPLELDQKKDALKNDHSAISAASWGKTPNLFLEELHRVYDEEQERRRAADTKASNYLLVAAALISILTYFGGLLVDTPSASKSPLILEYIAISTIAIAVLYILGFVWWSFKALKASSYETLGTNDLAALTQRTTTAVKTDLIKSLAKSVRSNQDQTNEKMTYVNLSHLFLMRIFIMFSLIAFIQCLIGLTEKLESSTPLENEHTPYSFAKVIFENEEFSDPLTRAQLSFKSTFSTNFPIASISLGIPRQPITQMINLGDSWSFQHKDKSYDLSIKWIDYEQHAVVVEIQQK